MKKIALWAVPRAVGTAFERVFVERQDTYVAHEIFMPCHYYSEDRASSRYDSVVTPEPRYAYSEVVKSLSVLQGFPILMVKEIAFHMKGIVDVSFWANFTHTFIIRDPAISLQSLYKLMPDFTFDEAGFVAAYELFDMATKRLGQVPIVVNGDVFRRSPKVVLAKYCELAGIPFQDTTTWSTQKVLPEWQRWGAWHKEVLSSTSVFKPPPKPAIELPPEVHAMIEAAGPYYEALNRFSISDTES